MSLLVRIGLAVLVTVTASVSVPGSLAATGSATAANQTTATPAVEASATTPSPSGPQPSRSHPHRKPWPVTLTIATVPPIPNVRLNFDGVPLSTDAAGRVTVTQQHNFGTHVLTLVNSSIGRADHRYRFERWSGQRDPDQAYQTTVNNLPMRANYTVTAAFAVQYLVRPRFIDNQGRPVDPSTITAVTLRSDTGAVIDLPRTGGLWLDGALPSYQKSSLVTSHLTYTLQSVVISGANTVDAGRQRLDPAANAAPAFTLKFADLTIRAHDALFDRGVGTQAELTYPDGSIRTVTLGPDHTVTVPHLPRGSYTVVIKGAAGIAPAQKLALSKDIDVDLTIVSDMDLAVVTAAVLVVALGLLLLGRITRVRRYLRTMISRLRGPAPPEKARAT